MFPLYQLVSHADSSRPQRPWERVLDSRRSPRRPRFGNLTIYPESVSHHPSGPVGEEPAVVAALRNVSGTGIAIVHGEPLPAGTVFRAVWSVRDVQIPVRFRVVHSQVVGDGIYRTGARLMTDDAPTRDDLVDAPPPPLQPAAAPPIAPAPVEYVFAERAAMSSHEINLAPVASETVTEIDSADANETDPGVVESAARVEVESAAAAGECVMNLDPSPATRHVAGLTPAPADVTRCTGAVQLVKAEHLHGVTPFGFERELDLCQIDGRLWLYIHSPGKRNGWGLYVDPRQLRAALAKLDAGPNARPIAA
jgi:hypothetical protein